MAMMHLLSERSPDGIIAEYRLLHELALLPSKNRVVQRNPLNLGTRAKERCNAPRKSQPASALCRRPPAPRRHREARYQERRKKGPCGSWGGHASPARNITDDAA